MMVRRRVSRLYLLTGESTQIAVDIQNSSTGWSISGEELIFTEYDGKQYNSSIVYLKYSRKIRYKLNR